MSRIDADRARLGDEGLEVGQSGRLGADGRFVDCDTDCDTERDTERDTESTREGRPESPGVMPGTVVELSETSGAKGSFFARLARKAATWDGSEAIIRR